MRVAAGAVVGAAGLALVLGGGAGLLVVARGVVRALSGKRRGDGTLRRWLAV